MARQQVRARHAGTQRRARLRVLAALAAGSATVLGLSGCGALQLESLPAPAGVSGAQYSVHAQFQDVDDLTEGAKVKLAGVVIGDVTSISTRNYVATVTMSLLKKFPLAADATMQIRFTTPLGEDYISVTSVLRAGQPTLAGGVTLPATRTGDAPSIEDTFSALSVLLNGGGLNHIQTIVSELLAALNGHTSQARDAIVALDKVLANFDANKGEFDQALDGLHAVAAGLAKDSGLITQALDTFPSTLQLMAQDTSELDTLLPQVGHLGDVVSNLVQRSQSALVSDLTELRPTLASLSSIANRLVPAMNSLITFGKLFDRATPGDYLNLDATIRFLLQATPQEPAVPSGSHAPAGSLSSALQPGGSR